MGHWVVNNIQNIHAKLVQLLKPVYSKQSVIFSWLFSYALVLLVPVLISGIIYINTVRVVKDEITKSNQFLLKRVEQRMDGLIKDAIRLSQEIAFNSRINELLKLNDATKNPYDIYLAVKELKTYSIPYTSIDDFYVYFKNIDLVLSPYCSGNSLSFFEAFLKNTGISYRQWFQLITDYHNGSFLTINSLNGQGRPRKRILFIRTIPLLYQNGSTANIIVSIDESRFIEDAKDIQTLNKGTLLLLDQNNKIIASSRSIETIKGISYDRLRGDNGMFRAKINREKVMVSYLTSQVNHWKYLTIIPNRVFWEKAEFVRNLIYTSLIFCLLIGGLITIYALKKNYNPVMKLIRMLEKYLGLNYDKTNNEYQFIERGIDQVHANLEKIDAILSQQNSVLKSHFLIRLIQGKLETKFDINERFALYDIAFISDFFAVMAFYITDFEDIKPEQNEILENFKQAKLKITHTVEALVREKNYGYMVDNDDLLICLVNLNYHIVGEAKAELTRIILTAQKHLNEQFKIHFTASASAVHQTLAGIPEAYYEALQAMEYKKLFGVEEIIHFEDFKDLPKGSYYYPLEKEYQLINSIKAGDYPNSRVILDEIFQKNFTKRLLPLKTARCLMLNLVSTMIKAINEVNSDSDNFLESLNPVENLLECKNINEMKQEMLVTLEKISNYIEQKNYEKKKNRVSLNDSQLVKKVKAYIEQNYYDTNINISVIAGYFKIHPVTLSRIFNEQTDEGLLEYINRVRIKKAEALFKEKGGNLEEVAKTVGYYSIRTFTRAFKKYAGVTPGKFKESNREASN